MSNRLFTDEFGILRSDRANARELEKPKAFQVCTADKIGSKVPNRLFTDEFGILRSDRAKPVD
ncbi:hypothetical protein [Hominifimenecus sp. rT4P-3]|uniref:hypothetical protein n=1 Tax=Hominifimenecus sp. rT4P-3 TaxID=3242979 RepID=UPI003DA6B1DB